MIYCDLESKQDSRGASRRASRLSMSKTPQKLTPEDSTLSKLAVVV